MKNAKVIDETTVIRTIRTYPREKYVGRWKRGRLYPLYNIVSNNGSLFLSLCGKMKDEPYVIYDKDKDTFFANDGWAIKEMSADSRLTAMNSSGDGDSPSPTPTPTPTPAPTDVIGYFDIPIEYDDSEEVWHLDGITKNQVYSAFDAGKEMRLVGEDGGLPFKAKVLASFDDRGGYGIVFAFISPIGYEVTTITI